METKVCNTCLKELPVDMFHKNKSALDGLQYRCKSCTKLYDKQYCIDNAEHIKERRKQYSQSERGKEIAIKKTQKWVEKNPEKYKAHQALNSAIRTGTFPPPTKCSVCGVSSEIKRIVYHHWRGYLPENYFDVIEYCDVHHKAEHSRLKKLRRICLKKNI